MKTWPETITKIYPLPPFEVHAVTLGRAMARHPHRPWWTWCALDANAMLNGEKGDSNTMRLGWLRRDQRFVLVESIGNFLTAAMFGKAEFEAKLEPHNFELVEKTDALAPLPFPGYRLGQIWAKETGESVVVSQIDNDLPIIHGRVFCQSEARGGGHIGWYENKTGRMDEAYAYLVHDPACPWLAPWVNTENPLQTPSTETKA